MIILILFLLLLPLQGCYSQDAENSSLEQKAADPYAWDFGRVKQGEITKHDFELKNESENTLNIKDVNTSCGCTVSKVEKKVLSPGESTVIEVQFNSKGYSGPIQQFVYVNTDSLDKPILRFIIKANVVK
jgi:hypothetical protein